MALLQVLPGMLLCGAMPASLDDAETEQLLTALLEAGVCTFVCLQAEVDLNCPESAWRAGHGKRPYLRDAQQVLKRAQESGDPRISQRKLDFLHLPIVDGGVTTDSAMSACVEECMRRILVDREVLYVHCWGGHGRTGTLVSVILGRLYNLPSQAALRHTQAYHDAREVCAGVRSPQTPAQRAQVRRLLAAQSAVSSPPTPTPQQSLKAASQSATKGVLQEAVRGR